MIRTLLPLTAAVLLGSAPAAAQSPAPTNSQIDYPGFVGLTLDMAEVREAHRLSWPDFIRQARAAGAILLDARSESAFARGHIDGAVNLPFTDFTAASLRAAIGKDPNRPIFIYCNNNFSDNRDPVVTKAAPLALNIPTFINLHGYGYHNVWELADRIATTDAGVNWRGTTSARADPS